MVLFSLYNDHIFLESLLLERMPSLSFHGVISDKLAQSTKADRNFYSLDNSKGSGKVAGYAFGILAAIIVIFGVVWLVIWARTWLTEKKLGMTGKIATRKRSGYNEERDMAMEERESR